MVMCPILLKLKNVTDRVRFGKVMLGSLIQKYVLDRIWYNILSVYVKFWWPDNFLIYLRYFDNWSLICEIGSPVELSQIEFDLGQVVDIGWESKWIQYLHNCMVYLSYFQIPSILIACDEGSGEVKYVRVSHESGLVRSGCICVTWYEVDLWSDLLWYMRYRVVYNIFTIWGHTSAFPDILTFLGLHFKGHGFNFVNASHGIRLRFGHGQHSYIWNQVSYNKFRIKFDQVAKIGSEIGSAKVIYFSEIGSDIILY